jgi:hypothetical protein
VSQLARPVPAPRVHVSVLWEQQQQQQQQQGDEMISGRVSGNFRGWEAVGGEGYRLRRRSGSIRRRR